MTRDEYTEGFAQRLRNVLQKQGLAQVARSQVALPRLVGATLEEIADWARADLAARSTETNLDATIQELADFTWDAFAPASVLGVNLSGTITDLSADR